MTFSINDDATWGEEIHLDFVEVIVADESGVSIPTGTENGYISIGMLGDTNQDGELNVLDLVVLVNFALQIDDPTDYQFWAGDINEDGDLNILDVVQLINLILSEDVRSVLAKHVDSKIDVQLGNSNVIINGEQISGFEFTTNTYVNIISHNLPAQWNIHSSDTKVIGYSTDGTQMDNIIINFEGEGVIERVLLSDGCGCPLDMDITVVPEEFTISQNYPNPFNPSTRIDFGLPQDSFVSIYVYDINGRQVAELLNSNQLAGYHSIVWNAQDQSSGIYFLRISTQNDQHTMKLNLMK